MFVHSVYFWLKPDLDPQQLGQFVADLQALEHIDAVGALYVGRAAKADRPVVDDSYGIGLTVVFTDEAGHDAYQVHPLHKDFISKHSHQWERIVVYDTVSGG